MLPRKHKMYSRLLFIGAINDYITKYNNQPVIYDIGTGTGLLSLYAAKYGAKKIISFEQFKYLSQITQEIMTENSYQELVQVVPENSQRVESKSVNNKR